MSEVSSEPVIAPLPTPISVEPRVAAPAEAAEVARQSEEAALAANSRKAAEPVAKETKEEVKKPLSTREALRAAREKVNAEPASPLKAAEPAPKTAEPVAAATKDAPVAKAAEPKAAAEPVKDAPVARGEDGKFVSTKAPAAEVAATSADVAKGAEVAAKTAEPAPAPKLPSHTAEPPPARFSAAAKEKWAESPDEVRAEVTRAVTELTKGFEKHRAAAERDQSLAEFHEMAGKSNKQLRDVVAQYVGMENELRADPVKGFEAIAQNLGIPLKDIAARILNQAPDVTASKADATIIELRNQNSTLEKRLAALEGAHTQQKTDSTTEAVTKFAADHPRFEELSEDIAFFLKTRTKDLAEAYNLAERLNPAAVKEVPAQAAPAASSAPVVAEVPKPTLVPPAVQTDAGQKSIAGAPSAGSDPVRKQPSSSIKEALLRARQRAG